MKRPSFQFYPADWRKDAALQSCSMAAQGLWINLMCIAHECEPYGHLTVNGRSLSASQIARLVGLSAKECGLLIQELVESGVAGTDEGGAIYSRRMVRDEQVRNARAEGGKAGSSHGHKGAEHGVKGGRPRKETGDKKPPLEPPPSSSSSSSSSDISVPIGTGSGTPPPQHPQQLLPDEIIFGYGLAMLTNAGTAEKHARSFLGGLRKQHGDVALVNKLRECARAKPLQPLEWLAAALPPGSAKEQKKLNQQEALEAANRAVAERFLEGEIT